MAVKKTEAVALSFLPQPTTETNTFNIDISHVNPFNGEEAQKATLAPKQESGNPVFGAEIVKETAKKTTVELPAAKRQNAFGILANYLKNIGSQVTEYDNAVKIVNQYMPNKYDTYAAIESNPRIAAIINTNQSYRAYLQANNA